MKRQGHASNTHAPTSKLCRQWLATRCLPGICCEGKFVCLLQKASEGYSTVGWPAIWPCGSYLEERGVFQVLVAVQAFVEGLTPGWSRHGTVTEQNGICFRDSAGESVLPASGT